MRYCVNTMSECDTHFYMVSILVAVVLSTVNLTGEVTADGGDFKAVDFAVPPGSQECQIAHSDGDPDVILDWGIWSPDGFRGWGGGLTDDAVVGVAASSRGYLPGALTPGTWQIIIGKAKLKNAMGHYDITVTCADTATLVPVPRSGFAATVVSQGPRWMQGDFHVHSDDSGDANASLMQISGFAKSRGLDFVAISDHNTISQHGLIAEAQKALPDFLLLRSVEVTTYQGHGNALGVSRYVDHRVGFAGVDATTIINDVVAQGGVFSVNHPDLRLGTACIGCAWDHPVTPWQHVSGIEIHTGAYDLVHVLFTPTSILRWDALEAQGFRLAALGGSDDHDGGTQLTATKSQIGSPTTVVWAQELSEAGIIAAIKHQRTYVKLRSPADPNVDFIVRKPDGSAAMLGDTVTDLQGLRFSMHIVGGAGMYAGIWRDGVLAAPATLVTSDDFTTTVELVPTGALERFRLELTDEGGDRVVVTSHIYAQASPLATGCGCQSQHGVSTLLLGLAIFVGVGVVRRRKRQPVV